MDENEAPELPELDDMSYAALHDELDEFAVSGQFPNQLGNRSTTAVIGWLDEVKKYVDAMAPADREAYNAFASQMIEGLWANGVDLADENVRHGVAWGIYTEHISQKTGIHIETMQIAAGGGGLEDFEHMHDIAGHVARGGVCSAIVADRLLNGITV